MAIGEMTIGELVERLIAFRDRSCKTLEEKDLLADAINLIDHNFDRAHDVYIETKVGQYNR